MKRIMWLLLLPLLGLCSCREASASSADGFPSAEQFQPKTPKLPATYLDTTRAKYAWAERYNIVNSVRNRIEAPEGFQRVEAAAGSFGEWLRHIPLKPGRPEVMLHNGQPKGNQEAHHAVVNIDPGTKDLQQCADAVMRLRAEFLYATKQDDAISFNFTSGHPCPFSKWKQGLRPRISGNQVSWNPGGSTGRAYSSFRAYMDQVFTYAGTASLSKELKAVPDPAEVQIGDVFIQGGFPGHAVIVMDVAADAEGNRAFLLAQSYMPAQDIHILRNPSSEGSPWYMAKSRGTLETPEWTFRHEDLRRF